MNRDKLEDERWDLMNSFGVSPWNDGLTRDRIAAIDDQLAQIALTTGERCAPCSGHGFILADNSDHGVRIERCDNCQVFPSDEAAVTFAFKIATGQSWKVSTAFYVERSGTRFFRIVHRFRTPNPRLDPATTPHVFTFDARREHQQGVEFRTTKRQETVAEGIKDDKVAFKIAEILNESIDHLILK